MKRSFMLYALGLALSVLTAPLEAKSCRKQTLCQLQACCNTNTTLLKAILNQLNPNATIPTTSACVPNCCSSKKTLCQLEQCCANNTNLIRAIQLQLNPAAPEYDYIIVGLGTAGALLARKLSDNFSNSVLVLEAGDNRSTDPNVLNIPFDTTLLSVDPRYAVATLVYDPRSFDPTLGPITELFGTGKGWGGGSMHNFLLTVRGASQDWDSWATATGDSRWSYANLLPFMKAIETYNFVVSPSQQPADRGTSGPLQVTQYYRPLTALATTMSTQEGSPIVNDYNVGLPTPGNSLSITQAFYTNTAVPIRSFSINAFLPPTVLTPTGFGADGRNLRVLSPATAEQVLFNGTTAIGVRYIHNDQSFVALARKKIIICAGCPHSAALLQRSGVGDPAVLAAAGVPVVISNTNVGKNLVTHYGVFGLTDLSAAALLGAGPLEARWVSFADGVSGTTDYYAGLGAGFRRIQFLQGSAGEFFKAAAPEAFKLTGATDDTLGFVAWYLRPRSLGTANIISTDPFALPQIRFNLFSDGPVTDTQSDVYAAVTAYKIMRQVAIAAGGDMIFPSPADYAAGDAALASDAYAFVDNGLTVTNHYSGTANMGLVVDSTLNVIGAQNLMVADNSIIPVGADPMDPTVIRPLIESGNTAWQAYVIGAVAANILGAFNP